MKSSFFYLLVLMFIVFAKDCIGQELKPDTTTLYLIEAMDGNDYTGYILQKDSASIRLRTVNIGVIELQMRDIKKISEVKKDEIKNGSTWYEVLQSSRYFWSPNGYGLKTGESYYQNIWVLFNQFGLGLTDHFSCGFGLIPTFLFAGTATPVWLTPKFSIPVVKDKFNLGIGALTGLVVGANSGGFGIVYGIATVGSRDNNASFGMGYGYADKSWAKKPMVTLSGMLRVSKKAYLMTENYILNFGDSRLVLSVIGGRSLIRKTGLDYGLAIPFYSNMDTFIAIPWLGITIPIESKQGVKPVAGK